MSILWTVIGLALIIFLVASIRLLRRYGRQNVSRKPDNLSGLPPEVTDSDSDLGGVAQRRELRDTLNPVCCVENISHTECSKDFSMADTANTYNTYTSHPVKAVSTKAGDPVCRGVLGNTLSAAPSR